MNADDVAGSDPNNASQITGSYAIRAIQTSFKWHGRARSSGFCLDEEGTGVIFSVLSASHQLVLFRIIYISCDCENL